MLLSAVGFTESAPRAAAAHGWVHGSDFCSQSWDFWPDIPTVERKLHHTGP